MCTLNVCKPNNVTLDPFTTDHLNVCKPNNVTSDPSTRDHLNVYS